MADQKPKPTPRPDAPIDYSMMGVEQVVNLCLQRSNRVSKLIPSLKRTPTGWPDLMRQTATVNRDTILAEVTAEIEDMFAKIAPTIARFAPKRLADIGCGQAFIDLLIYRRFGCDLVLIDIEQTDRIHFGFKPEGAGYADLANARAFLVANGVPERAITTINPRQQALADLAPVDMAISLISCGFHYPVATYDSFFQTQVRKAILLDCRTSRPDGATTLASYGQVESVGREKKHERLLCVKAAPKAVPKTAAKPASKAASKPASKAASKPASKVAAKPASKPASKPAARSR